MKLSFEWDEEKAKANLQKHRAGFNEATTFSPIPFQLSFMTLTIQRLNSGILTSVVLTRDVYSWSSIPNVVRPFVLSVAERLPHQSRNVMRKAMARIRQKENNDMRTEYDFRGGVRGKHYRAMQAGYTITVHKWMGQRWLRRSSQKKELFCSSQIFEHISQTRNQ